MDHHQLLDVQHVHLGEIHPENVQHYGGVLTSRIHSNGVLRGADGEPLQFIAVSRNGQHEYIDNSMLTAEYINNHLNNGLVVNFATTDQTIQAAQQNQQQLLAQTTVIDEQYVVQSHEHTEIVTHHQLPKEELHHHQFVVDNEPQVDLQKVTPPMPSLTPIPRALPAKGRQAALRLSIVKSENEEVEWLHTNESDQVVQQPVRNQQPLTSPRVSATKRALGVPTALPHKKRIRNAVPQVKPRLVDVSLTAQLVVEKKVPVVQRQLVDAQVALAPKVETAQCFTCEICLVASGTQLEFFRHLKLHYEPATLKNVVAAAPLPAPPTVVVKQQPQKISTVPVVPLAIYQAQPVALLEQHSKRTRKPTQRAINAAAQNTRATKKSLAAQDNTTPQPSLDGPQSVQELLDQFPIDEQLDVDDEHQSVTQDDDDHHDDGADSDYAANDDLEPDHVPQEDTINEFSDTEDMLEGIRGAVDKAVQQSGDNDLDLVDKDGWFEGELNEEIIFSANDIEGNPEAEEGEPAEEGVDDATYTPDASELVKVEESSGSEDEAAAPKAKSKKRGLRSNTAASQLKYTETRDETTKSGKKGKGKKCFKCAVCGKVCNSMNSLQYHFLSHTGERPHQCEECGKGFLANSALKVHMRLHTGDKPYSCEVCNRAFRQWGDLKYHMTSLHSEEKNHQCEFCGKDFARRYSLVIHRRIHTGERNYKCEYCDKTFRASTYLQDHRRIHTGEKPHKCEYCNKKFRVRSDMKRHWNIHLRAANPTAANGAGAQQQADDVAQAEFDEVAAAIQIIDDGNGGFTVKKENDAGGETTTNGLFKVVDPLELAKKMPKPRTKMVLK